MVDVDPATLRDLSDAGLYNLSEDIGETRNRAAERPDKVTELSDLWQQWNRQLAKPSWAPNGETISNVLNAAAFMDAGVR